MFTVGLVKLALMKGHSRLLYFSVFFVNFIAYIRLILLFSRSGINQATFILFHSIQAIKSSHPGLHYLHSPNQRFNSLMNFRRLL